MFVVIKDGLFLRWGQPNWGPLETPASSSIGNNGCTCLYYEELDAIEVAGSWRGSVVSLEDAREFSVTEPPPEDDHPTIPFMREKDVAEEGVTIRCKTSWETGPYRVQYERGTGGVDVGTTRLSAPQLCALIDALELAREELAEHG